MNMKLNRILSSVLTVIMLFSAVVLLIPVKAEAAHYSFSDDTTLDKDEVEKIVTEYQKAEFESLEAMFRYDKAQGYLSYAKSGDYSIYVNKHTGVLYYRNEATGEMLSSNSYNFKGIGGVDELTSQISVTYAPVTDTEKTTVLHSSTWAAKFNQITVTEIDNGLRVNYAIGDTAIRCLLPVMIKAEDFENDILRPMYKLLYDTTVENFGAYYALDYFSSRYYNETQVYKEVFLHQSSMRKFKMDFALKIEEFTTDYQNQYGPMPQEIIAKVGEVENIMNAIDSVFNAYQAFNPKSASFKYDEKTTPAIALEYPIYKVKETKYAQMAPKAEMLEDYCPGYNFEMMYAAEKECDYKHPYEPKPVFRCALEYTFNDDGSFSVRLPANSIVFDETEYILRSITPLQYFGAANFANDGYIFIPDGSGSVIEFEDFRSSNVAMSSSLSFYGNDFCYSEISGAHKQPLTMPVYGIASSKTVNGNKQSIGYFAILEEGASMASMNVKYKSTSFREGSVYTTFTPYPTDKFDLSETISVGGAQFYSKVSESKYSGSYVTRYVMLTGDKANYIGMADYYRSYLEGNGTLTPLENVGNDLPLYLEALGSLEVVEKVLTFPVNVSKAITTFEDIETIYTELGDAKAKLEAKAAEYQALADAEEDNLTLKEYYADTAANYIRLAGEITNIDNINFKLTGFANGGLYSTYPAKLKWERAVGGKRGFKNLLETAKENTDSDSTMGIYPDFDFQYINNTALFDKVGKRNTVSRMVDNRYASKQVYSSITGEYDTVYAMIISADALDRLYTKFLKKYDNYKDATGISVSTLGSDLNSNFDKDNPVSRDDAQGYVTELLDKMAKDYSVMISQGNIYAVKYADHILNVCTDSSYYRYSSYTIPFTGMILHGYVNYAGSPLNYSGSPDYDILRSIENGASIYYIIGYQNTDIMKDDEEFNKYYSISYEHWFDDIVEKYALINSQIGNLQDYHIVGHEVLIGERVIDPDEQVDNLKALMNEFADNFRQTLESEIDIALGNLYNPENPQLNKDKRIGVAADIDSLVAVALDMFGRTEEELNASEDFKPHFDSFKANLAAILAEFNKEYDTTGVAAENIVTVRVDTIDYESKYQYVTESTARDENYDHTDYTVDNDLIVMVTYQKGEDTVSFILNYNIYSVEVTLEGREPIIIEKYGFYKF